jgi:hypothetical protein
VAAGGVVQQGAEGEWWSRAASYGRADLPGAVSVAPDRSLNRLTSTFRLIVAIPILIGAAMIDEPPNCYEASMTAVPAIRRLAGLASVLSPGGFWDPLGDTARR